MVDSTDINNYLREHTCDSNDKYSAKDFRTWMASVLAASYLYDEMTGLEGDELLASEPDSRARQTLVTEMVKTSRMSWAIRRVFAELLIFIRSLLSNSWPVISLKIINKPVVAALKHQRCEEKPY